MKAIIWILILAVCALGLASAASAEGTDIDQVNGTLENLSAASEHFQTGIQEISGDVNVSNATTTLADTRSEVAELIRAFNDLIRIVNTLLGLVSENQLPSVNLPEIQPLSLNLSET